MHPGGQTLGLNSIRSGDRADGQLADGVGNRGSADLAAATFAHCVHGHAMLLGSRSGARGWSLHRRRTASASIMDAGVRTEPACGTQLRRRWNACCLPGGRNTGGRGLLRAAPGLYRTANAPCKPPGCPPNPPPAQIRCRFAATTTRSNCRRGPGDQLETNPQRRQPCRRTRCWRCQ